MDHRRTACPAVLEAVGWERIRIDLRGHGVLLLRGEADFLWAGR